MTRTWHLNRDPEVEAKGCPTCKAEVDEPCVTNTGKVTQQYHMARIRLRNISRWPRTASRKAADAVAPREEYSPSLAAEVDEHITDLLQTYLQDCEASDTRPGVANFAVWILYSTAFSDGRKFERVGKRSDPDS